MIEKTIFIVKPIFIPIGIPADKFVQSKTKKEQIQDIYLQMLQAPKYSTLTPAQKRKLKKVKLS